jgi:gamma-glutamyltranspeptidase
VRFNVLLSVAFSVLAEIASCCFAQERQQKRSVVMNRYGVVAAGSPLVAQAGAMILRDRGNAIDAAIATTRYWESSRR